jgi:hypothetical protein
MTTESEAILARYRATEKEADTLGRLIKVRRLRPSEQTKLKGMAPELGGYDEVAELDINGQPTGKVLMLPHRLELQLAASVCEIDSAMIAFPRNRGELDAIYDKLADEGLAAASAAYIRLVGRREEDGDDSDARQVAKN